MKKLILSLLILFSAMAYSQGTIPIPSIIGLPAAMAGKVDKVTGKSLVADTLSAKIQPHVTNTANPHSVTKAQVGLGNVDNTSDVNKPISSATQTALNGKQPTGTYSTDIHANITALNAVQGVNHGDQTDITGNAGTATKLQTSRTINGVAFDGTQNITITAVDATSRVASSLLGAANGVATLDANGIILTTQLPSYIDDVLEYNNLAAFPGTGETGKIYVAKDTNKTYRWSGSVYVYITSGAVDAVNGYTGVVSLSKSDIGLSNVDNTSDANKPVSTAMQSALNGKQASGTYSTDIHSNITALNDVLGSNHGDETLTSIKTKLGAASSSNAGYLTNTDWTRFEGKQNALGFTPYNATNPNGYISGITSGQVTTALGYTPLPTRTFGSAANNNTGDFYTAGSTVTNSTSWSNNQYGGIANTNLFGLMGYNSVDSKWTYYEPASIKSWLGLGSSAYINSTDYIYNQNSYVQAAAQRITGPITLENLYPYIKLTNKTYNGDVFFQTGVTEDASSGGNYTNIYNPTGQGFSIVRGGVVDFSLSNTTGAGKFSSTVTASGYKIPGKTSADYILGDGTTTSVSGAVYKGQIDGSTGGGLADGTGTTGWYYACSIAGTHNYGSGNITLAIGDQLYYNGSVWLKIPGAGSYTLPFASTVVLGGVRQGNGTSINSSGIISIPNNHVATTIGTAAGLTMSDQAINFTSGYSIPTTANQSNWSTAYGWGNHSGLYLPLSGGSVLGDVQTYQLNAYKATGTSIRGESSNQSNFNFQLQNRALATDWSKSFNIIQANTGWVGFGTNGHADVFKLNEDGTVAVTQATSSTSPTTGALVVGGGIGVGGKIFIGSTEQSDMDGTAINSGAIQTNGGISAVKDINSGANINAYGNLTAYGTVRVAGGTPTQLMTRDGGYVESSSVGGLGDSYTCNQSNISNISSSSVTVAFYTKVGSVYNISITGFITASSTGTCTVRLPMPTTITSSVVPMCYASINFTTPLGWSATAGSNYIDLSINATSASSLAFHTNVTYK